MRLIELLLPANVSPKDLSIKQIKHIDVAKKNATLY